LFAWLKVKPVDPETKEKIPNEDNSHEPNSPPQALARKPEAPKPISNQQHSNNKRAKIHPYLKFAVSVFTMLAVVWFACEARKQRIAAEETNVENRNNLANQTRPWVAVVDPANFDTSHGPTLKFDIWLTNYGQSPAIVVLTPFKLIHIRQGRPADFNEHNVCSRVGKSKAMLEKAVETNNPTEIVFPTKEGTTKREIWTESDGITPNGNYNFLIGCIAYRGPLGGPYYTRVIYRLEPAYISAPKPIRVLTGAPC
jgi:hypothetical protein